MLVGVDSSTSRSVGASETGKRRQKQKLIHNQHFGDNTVSERSIKTGIRTCFLCPTEWQALLCPAHCEDVDQVLRVRLESRQSEVLPGGGQPLILRPPTIYHLVTNAEASDFSLGRLPVDGEGVGHDLRELQTNW